MKKSIIISFFAIFTGMGFTSCLDTESNRFVDWDRELTPQDSVYHMLGILNNLKEIGARYVLLGEVRADLVRATPYAPVDVQQLHTMDISNTNNYTSKREYYRIINQCNYVIEKGQALPRERAAAITIRAWTYLQLVLNYGKTKYYGNFISSEEEANGNFPEYDLNALIDEMIPQLEAVKNVQLPTYGEVGGITLSTQMLNPKFVLGDYYLWAGSNDSKNYERAAELFYELMMNDGMNTSHLSNAPYSATVPNSDYSNISMDKQFLRWMTPTYSGYTYNWGRMLNREPISYINYPNPDSTSVRCDIDTLCGYPTYEEKAIAIKPSSVASTVFSTTNYAYVDATSEMDYISEANSFLRYVFPLEANYDKPGDLRSILTLAPASDVAVQYGPGGLSSVSPDTVISKYSARFGENRKAITLQRVAMIYLRYAEAVNRAGKPNLAMIALKYGLGVDNIDMYMPSTEKPGLRPAYNDNGERIEGAAQYQLRGLNTRSNQTTTPIYENLSIERVNHYKGKVPMSKLPDGSLYINEESDTIYYCFNDSTESYYDFSRNKLYFNYNYGLHTRGAGCAPADTTYRMPYEVHPMPSYGSSDPAVLKLQQEYMENVICNEYVLELAFEGGRFYDLMRFSRYQGSPAFLARYVSRKPGAKSFTILSTPSARGWDSDSWYLPVKAGEKQ